MIIGILTAAIVLVVAFIVYITCFDSHIEFSSKFKNGITVEYGKSLRHQNQGVCQRQAYKSEGKRDKMYYRQ